MTEPTVTIESWSIDNIHPYARNAKKHPPEQIDKLARAIETTGWDQPIVVDQHGVIIKGHGRRLAAIKLGKKFVPVICRRDLTPDEADAARLSDNQVSSNLYDTTMVQEEIARLNVSGFDITTLGFEDKDLSFLTADLLEMDESVLVDNVGEAVEAQKIEHGQTIDEIDAKEVPLSKAFGFKGVPGAKQHIIVRFMAQLEAESGKNGADALCHFIQNLEAA